LSANINKLAGATNQLAGATSNLDKQLETLINGLNAKSEAMGEIIKSLTPEEQKTLAKQITIVMAPADLSSLSTLKANIDAINNNVQALNTNVNALANGTKDLSSSVNTLSTNMNLIADGSNKFNANLGYFTSSMNTLNEASNNKVIPGIQKLNNGSTELYNGLVKFDSEGIKVLYNTINTTLKNKVNTLNSLNNLSENYNSFAGTANGTKSETKFIIQINK
jgi:X-X-X-Leu-X-X-Gly heptad repeat protein